MLGVWRIVTSSGLDEGRLVDDGIWVGNSFLAHSTRTGGGLVFAILAGGFCEGGDECLVDLRIGREVAEIYVNVGWRKVGFVIGDGEIDMFVADKGGIDLVIFRGRGEIERVRHPG